MARHLPTLTALALMAIFASPMRADAEASPANAIAVAIDDFIYLDTSGELTDQAAAHRSRLEQFMAALRGDVAADHTYRLVASACTSPCTQSAMTPDRLRTAKADGAAILITGAIHKMSTLVQWAKVSVVDTGTNRVVFDKLYTFRGDNEQAWQRAETFVSQDIRAALAAPSLPTLPAAAQAPVNLAVFDFELEDESAATSQVPSDAKELANTTEAIRQLLGQSGRYRVVTIGGSDAAKTPLLHDCAGCDAGIAQKLGADQSFVGVVRRISRTEYTIRFQLRDAQAGTVLAAGNTGLRMGANYSWSRGAVRLVRDRLLDAQPRQ
jgi:hypothetical protein